MYSPAPAPAVASLRRTSAIALTTLRELTRLRVFYVLLLFGLLLVGSSLFLARLTFQQELQILKDVALGAISIISSILAVVTASRLLSQDMEDRTLYTILAKPVTRSEYVIGKLTGVFILLTIAVAVMSVIFWGVLFLREQALLANTAHQFAELPADQREDALQNIRDAAVTPGLLPAIVTIYLKAALLATLTLLVSTIATSNLFTVMLMVFIYFIGHLQGTAREFWLTEGHGGILAKTLLAVVALIFPDFQLFNFVDGAVAGAVIPLTVLLKTSALGVFYILIYTLIACAIFHGREI